MPDYRSGGRSMRLRDRSELRTAANVIGVLLLIAVVVPFLVYGFPQVVGADHGFVVLSGSMEPAMSPGDAIIVREVGPEEIEERDVITYQTDSDTPTTHRVIDVVERDGSLTYQTKGDANEDADPGSVSPDQVIGEVLFVIPLLGYVVRFVNTTVGFAALVVVPLVLFTLSELRALLGSVRDDADSTGPATDTGGEGDIESSQGTASAAEPESPSEGQGDGAITLTKSSLQLLGVVFALYLPYSAYVAYTTTAAWSITAAIATGIALLFVGGLYVGIGGSQSDSDGDADSSSGDAAVDGSEADSPVSPKRSVEADGGELVANGGPVGDEATVDGGPDAAEVAVDGDRTVDEVTVDDDEERMDPDCDTATCGVVGNRSEGGTADE